MTNEYICVIILASLSDQLVQSYDPDRSTISPSEAAAEYNRKVKLYEQGHNFSDSSLDLSLNPVESVGDVLRNHPGDFMDIVRRTTIDPKFVTKVRRPPGYYKQLLVNNSIVGSRTSKIDATTVKASTSYVTTVKALRSTTRWTPYPDYNSAEERSLQRKCPQRVQLLEIARRKHLARITPNSSVSEESVPSSCECHAGNWSESYDFWDKWKKKQCKPMFLNHEYGMNLEGTKFRKGHEPEWYKKQKKKDSSSAESSEASSRHVPKSPPHRGHAHHHPGPGGYPHNPPVYPPPHMGYPPMYFPYAMPPQMPPYYPPQYNQPQYNYPNQPVMDPVAYQKLEDLHREIKELKEKTTLSMWDQYLKLKEKFETTPTSNVPGTHTSSYQRLVSYRRLEKKEPFFSKFQSNVVQMRPSSNNNTHQRARLQFNEQYQRTVQNNDIYRNNPFLVEDGKVNERETFNNHFLRITPAEIHKNEPYNRYETRAVHASSPPPRQYRTEEAAPPERRVYASRMTRYPTRVYHTQTEARTYRRDAFYNRPSPRVAEQHIQDVRWKVQATHSPRVVVTSTLRTVGSTPLAGGEPTTEEDPYAVYRKYKAQYEFPDYVGEKRRLMRAKEKEAKRKLYAARGLVYDEEPPRITTRPPTTAMSEFYFKDRMEYFKYLFDDKSLPIDTTPTVFNNAPTFDLEHEDGQKAYLKWLLSDKSLEIDPMS